MSEENHLACAFSGPFNGQVSFYRFFVMLKVQSHRYWIYFSVYEIKAVLPVGPLIVCLIYFVVQAILKISFKTAFEHMLTNYDIFPDSSQCSEALFLLVLRIQKATSAVIRQFPKAASSRITECINTVGVGGSVAEPEPYHFDPRRTGTESLL